MLVILIQPRLRRDGAETVAKNEWKLEHKFMSREYQILYTDNTKLSVMITRKGQKKQK